MIICKDCRCFHPVTVSDRYCGECCIGDTRNPIAINADIIGCCLFEPKKPKPLTNGDHIRQMTDEELAEWFAPNMMCNLCDKKDKPDGCNQEECMKYALIYMKKVASEDAVD